VAESGISVPPLVSIDDSANSCRDIILYIGDISNFVLSCVFPTNLEIHKGFKFSVLESLKSCVTKRKISRKQIESSIMVDPSIIQILTEIEYEKQTKAKMNIDLVEIEKKNDIKVSAPNKSFPVVEPLDSVVLYIVENYMSPEEVNKIIEVRKQLFSFNLVYYTWLPLALLSTLLTKNSL
jgi:hypothetical protein